MAVYSNLNKVKKLTNSSLTSILDITNINFNNLSDAIKSFLDTIQYDEALNTMTLSSIELQSAVITSSLLVKQNGITTISIDNSGRIEGSSMLFEVTETQRQRFISYPDYPTTGVNGEVVFTGIDLIAWFDDRGWISLTTGNEGGDLVTKITTNSPYVTITPIEGTGEVTIDVTGGFGTLIGGADELGRIPKWTDTLELRDSSIFDDGNGVTIETDFYLPDIPEDSSNDFGYFLMIDPTSGGIVKYNSQVVRTISGNIVDDSDPNYPTIDQVQADWTQTNSSEVSFIQNKPEVLWYRGLGEDSLQPAYNTVPDESPISIGDTSLAIGDSTVAADKSAFSSGSRTIAGLTLTASKGEFEWHSSNSVRIPTNTAAFVNLTDVCNALNINQNLGIWNNVDKSYEFHKIEDIILGDDAYYIILKFEINEGILVQEYSDFLIIPNLEFANFSKASGRDSIASQYGSTAEGKSRTFGQYSHAEGISQAVGANSHSENEGIALGENSHAEGFTASAGNCSHTGGKNSIASGDIDFDAVAISKRVIVTPGNAGSYYQTGNPFVYSQVGGASYEPDKPNVLSGFANIKKSYQSNGGPTIDSIDAISTFSTRIFRTIFGNEASIYKVVPIRGGTLLAVCGNFYETGFGIGSFVQEVVSQGFIILNASDGSVFQHFPNGVDLVAGEEIKDCIELPDSSIMVAGKFVNFNLTNTTQHIHKLNLDGGSYVTDYGWGVLIDAGLSPSAAEIRQLGINLNGWIIAVGKFDRVNGTDALNAVALTPDSGAIVSSFELHSDAVLNTVLCYGNLIFLGGAYSFTIASDYAFTSPIPVNGIVTVNAATGAFDNTMQAVDSDVLQILHHHDNQFIACGDFTTVTDSASAVYTIGGLFKFYNNLEVDADFATQAGSGFDGNVTGIHVQENGKILAAGSFSTYGGNPTYNTVRLLENGKFDTDLLRVDNSTPYSILELPLKEVLVYGKINIIDGITAYGGMALMPNNGVAETTIILDSEIDQVIDGIAYAPLRLYEQGTSQFVHGEKAVALQDGDIAIGNDVIANGINSIATGIGSAAYIRGSSSFSSGYMNVHGDAQTLTFTQAYYGAIDLAGTKYHLGNNFEGTFVSELDMYDPLKSDALYRNWSIEYNAMVFIVDGGASDASTGSMQAITGHILASYRSATGTVTCTNQVAPTSSLGTLDADVSGTGAILAGTNGGSTIEFVYGNAGLDGIGDGVMKIAVTFKITESCVF